MKVYLSALAAAPLFWLALRLAGLSRCTAWIGRHARGSAVPGTDPRALAGMANAAVSRALGPRQCLTRSLVLLWLLARRGVTAQLRIGVRKDGSSQLLAHAWVEIDGLPVNDEASVVKDYAVFDHALPLRAFRG